jgi:hypothetical protein
MIYGFENGKFYIDFVSRTRAIGTMREESDRRAVEIASSYSKLVVGFSGGLDSQCMLHSFYTQGIPVETVFLYMPGYNDNEYNQVKICDQKYGIKTSIYDLNPIQFQDEFLSTCETIGLYAGVPALHRKLLSMLPEDCTFIQNAHDPFVYINPNSRKRWICYGHNMPEVARDRAFKTLNRSGAHIFWGDTTEYLLSIFNDDVFYAGLCSSEYFEGNGVIKDGKNLKTVDRWDYYIKPLIYGRYWHDELSYFPKFGGFENVPYIVKRIKETSQLNRQNSIIIPYKELVDFLNIEGGVIKRYYENHDPTTKIPYYDTIE